QNLLKLYHSIIYFQKLTSSHSILNNKWNNLILLIKVRKPFMQHNTVLSSSISNLRMSPTIKIQQNGTSFQFTDSFFPPRELVVHMSGCIDLLQMHPMEIANQLTLIDTEIYLKIELRELTNCSWQKIPKLEYNNLNNDNIFKANDNNNN